MKADATTSTTITVQPKTHAAKFSKVRDGRKQPIRSLWVRNERYYAQLTFEDANTGAKKTRLLSLNDRDGNPVQTVAQAKEALERLKQKRSENDLPVLKRSPKFADYVKTYLDAIRAGVGEKKPRTIEKEESSLGGWIKHLGGVHIDKIRMAHVNGYRTKRLKDGMSARTFNLDVIALRNVLKRAVEDGIISRLPTENLRPLKCSTPKRKLFTSEDLEALCTAAMSDKEDGTPVTKNWLEFTDYIRLLAYSGARRDEALALRWQDVDFERGQLTIGASGDTKNQAGRVVDFNPKLKAHLETMKKRLSSGSQWLFPSPQRGDKDIHAKSFMESLRLARAHAKMDGIAFHDLRHHFISCCVMSGIDYMTIASWVGHQDGGVLIGKVYGHLADAHKREQAQRVNFDVASGKN